MQSHGKSVGQIQAKVGNDNLPDKGQFNYPTQTTCVTNVYKKQTRSNLLKPKQIKLYLIWSK